MEVQEIFAILHKWGIHTLGQLAALDKEQLWARLGPEAIRMWERANGQSNRLLKLIRPPESFQESFEFEREIETAEPLLGGQTELRTGFQNSAADKRCRSSVPDAPDASGEFSI